MRLNLIGVILNFLFDIMSMPAESFDNFVTKREGGGSDLQK